MKVPGVNIDIAAEIIQFVTDHPEAAETIEDVVHADGAQRAPNNTFLEPGQEIVEEGAEGTGEADGAPKVPDDPFARAAEYAAEGPVREDLGGGAGGGLRGS